MANRSQKINKKEADADIRLYLRVHVMPKLNMPLRGKAWQWISPFVAAAILIVSIFYFLAD